MIRLGSRPRGVLPSALRMPVHLYRYDLGWLLGNRFLLLTHRGRKSGILRRTVLEVIFYDPVPRESVVVSGWRERSDWYRNVQAEPALEVQPGRERYVPLQRFLDVEEGYAVITAYAIRHPLAVRFVAVLFGYRFTRAEADRRSSVESYPLVAFRPRPATCSGSPG